MRVSPAAMLSVSLTIPLLPLASTKTRSSDQSFLFKQYALNYQSFSRPGRLVSENTSRRRWTFSCKCRNRGRNNHSKFDDEGEDFIAVNFYRFVSIGDPEAEIEKHFSFLKDLNIRGRIYLNEQGINAQYSGPSKDALAYVEWLKEDDRFSDLLVQISPAINGHAFPKLKLQNKPSLVQYEGGISHLPLLDPPMRAQPLEPSEWKRKLNDLTDDDGASSSGRSCILLDVRNGYEWDVGHFHGAPRPEVDCFRNTSFGLSDEKEAPSDPLINVDKEKTDILMYCTGGIRCDVYSAVLRQRGFKNLYTLKGGVSHYLKEEGTAEWVGNLFVFDSRLSLPPATYGNNAVDEARETPLTPVDTSFARCYICDSQIQELRHRNCANLDCNRLFLCCAECVVNLKGCCCSNCITAPRLRPVLQGVKRYEKWHVYRDSEVQNAPLA
ncbi:PREDICTED: rhodanese-like domain-containing protein 8, chloroplastic isoform X1 [Camelina sativa]|uniref:Rhodanese-like domain-containing protein 8, chloroplastic isoform X1 n=2 Tax=Camelina sativa TaxID=90675 RepID=A0ABM0VPV2_CAMSA|nr:PREDICTED: rhodanese-like domain-containing protein 8, chloroplastic isoform X1 [Camelina sativa]XP_010459400.1 PREDICTED: rhodanese-like domain-containing protein 8, chloroplastic isoform X1 [Camelina sativa]XP_010459401.1 PREDICTED: rhodanese-like domain-containing protein 8, chloroplastic isoform X1 [Camelina sativa]